METTNTLSETERGLSYHLDSESSSLRIISNTKKRNKGNSGSSRSVQTAKTIEEVREVMIGNPKIVARKNGLVRSKTTFNRFHPYHIHHRHGLRRTDPPGRERFGRWFLRNYRNPLYLTNLIISNETGLFMNGKFNTQNVKHYASKGKIPTMNKTRETLLVRAGLLRNGLAIDPFLLMEILRFDR